MIKFSTGWRWRKNQGADKSKPAAQKERCSVTESPAVGDTTIARGEALEPIKQNREEREGVEGTDEPYVREAAARSHSSSEALAVGDTLSILSNVLASIYFKPQLTESRVLLFTVKLHVSALCSFQKTFSRSSKHDQGTMTSKTSKPSNPPSMGRSEIVGLVLSVTLSSLSSKLWRDFGNLLWFDEIEKTLLHQ